MNFKKHIVLVVGGAIGLVLIVIMALLTLRYRSQYDSVDRDLQNSTRSLQNLQQRDPYPSEENVKLMTEKAKALQTYFDSLYGSLKEGQIEPVNMEAAQFPAVMTRLKTKLPALAFGCKLPPQFAFGFEQYAAGRLPAGEDIPRLSVQVKTIEEVCGLLFKAKIAELTSIRRQVFEKNLASAETEQASTGRRRGYDAQPQPQTEPAAQTPEDPSGLFSREHYAFAFSASETALWDILNRMAMDKHCMVITSLDLKNGGKLIKKVADMLSPEALAQAQAAAGGEPAEEGQPVTGIATAQVTLASRDIRVVAGREPVSVVLDLDVYRFTAAMPAIIEETAK